jgi:mono/diheme cytochrome c family protein
MNSRKATTRLAGVALALTLATGGAWLSQAVAQDGAASAKDYNQRALEIYEFRKAAKSGPDRGQEIFYYKCWFCHNEFTKDIPKLPGLFQRSTLVTGAPVNEESVKNQIRNGSANMAAYKYTLNEADLNDLVAYLREKCCWNSDAPPPNPRYIAR